MFARKFHLTVHRSRRSVCTTTVLSKQPALDRLRYRRHFPPPNHSLPFANDAPLKGLPKKTAFVSESWGSMEPSVIARRFKHGEQLKKIGSSFEKMQTLCHLEWNMWYHSLDLPLKCPEMLNYVQHLTRTKLLEMPSPKVQSFPLVADYLKHCLSEEFNNLNRLPINFRNLNKEATLQRSAHRYKFISSLMEYVFQAISIEDPSVVDRIFQIDERATVESFVKRLVPEGLFEEYKSVDEDLFNDVNETVLDNEGCVRYRIRSELAWQIRAPDPLLPFIDVTDPLCHEGEVPACEYRPEAFGLSAPVDCFQFSCLPYNMAGSHSEFARSLAGYWSRTPFWEGDPCEFGLLGILDANRAEYVHREVMGTSLSSELKLNILMRHALAEGLLTAFAWTNAQAFNQGFTIYNELTYPFMAQLILIDEEYIQLLRYQLNSITSLWKAEDAGLPFNLAWFSPKIRLYEYSNGEVSINTDAVSLLVSALLQPTDENHSSASLRPYLSDDAAPRDYVRSNSQPFDKRLIPDNIHKLDGKSSSADLEQETKKHPIRLYSPARPHPNDIYFLKMTKKEDLVQEFRESMPSFGGSFGELPAKQQTRLENFKIDRRNRQRRVRLESPPKRWR